MTNYINSITLEDGSTYNIGPFKIDDSSNIVYHDYSAPSSVSSNVIIGSPVLPNSSIHNNIIIGNPSIEGAVSDTILIGNSNFTIKVTSSSATVNNILGVSGAVGGGYVHAGPLALYYQVVNEPCVVYTGLSPATIYAAGIVSFDNGTVATVCGGVYVYPCDIDLLCISGPWYSEIEGSYCYNIFPVDGIRFGFCQVESSSVSFKCADYTLDPYAHDPTGNLASCNITIYTYADIVSRFM